MEAFLLIVLFIILGLLIAVNIYILALYVHAEDRGFGASIFPKAIVVLGLTLSWGQILMLPLDVSNTRGIGGGLDMDVFWEIIISVTSIMLVILIPYAFYYYDTGEEKAVKQRLTYSATYTAIYFILFCIVFFISYHFLGETYFPMQLQTLGASHLPNSDQPLDFNALIQSIGTNITVTSSTYNNGVSVPVYAMAFFSFIGWIFVVFFGGMGLFMIPIDLIYGYAEKPKQRSQEEILLKKNEIQEKIQNLIGMGQGIEEAEKDVDNARGFIAKRSAQGKVNKSVNKFKASVLALEKDFDTFSSEVNYKNVAPIDYTAKLVQGVFLILIAGIWWFHILLSTLQDSEGYPLCLFLNTLLILIDEQAGLTFIGVSILIGLCSYLMLAVIKGSIKFGMKIPFFFTIHPMKKNETLMNSFLFNIWFLLISSVAVVQFLTATFPQYARLTSAEFFFGTQVKYMKFFQIFYSNSIFEWAILAWSLLTLTFLCFSSMRRTKKSETINRKPREEIVL